MGFETVWQILGWVFFVYGVPIMLFNLLSKGTLARYGVSRSWATLSLPFWALALIWALVSAGVVLGAHWVHYNGGLINGWNVEFIPLFLVAMTVVMLGYAVPIHLNPCYENCTYLASYLAYTLLVSIAAFVWLLSVDLISGFVFLPMVVFIGFLWLSVSMWETLICGFSYQRYCEVWSDPKLTLLAAPKMTNGHSKPVVAAN